MLYTNIIFPKQNANEDTVSFNPPYCQQVNFFIGAFYDGVYLLGMALNETLTEGGDVRDGRNITRRMWGRDFHGKYSYC